MKADLTVLSIFFLFHELGLERDFYVCCQD